MLKRINLLLILFLGIIIINIGASIYYHNRVTNFLNHQQPIANNTVIATFFHDHNGKNNISTETKKRLNKAMMLNSENTNSTFICIGGLTNKLNYSGSYKMKEYLNKKGISDSLVYIDTTSFDTHSNWESIELLCKKHGWKNVAAISSPMHLYRISRIAKKSQLNVAYFTFLEEYKNTSLFKKWKDIQHEFVAIVLHSIIPEEKYKDLILKYKVRYFNKE